MAQRTLSYSFLERLLLQSTRPRLLRNTPTAHNNAPNHNHTSKYIRRYASAYRHAVPVTTTNTRLPASITQTLDERIGTLYAQLVDSDAKIHPPKSLRVLLSQIDRSAEHLRKVADGPDGVPVVKVVSRESLVQLVKSKEAVAKKKDVAELAKQVELNWAVSENDLGYRLKQIAQFLGEGKRVEIMIAPKKKGRRADPEECLGLMGRIKETVEGVEGAGEWKEMQGTLGKVVELCYKGREEGQAELKERAMGRNEEKAMRKEAEKAEKKMKVEARMRRKEEETRRQEEEKRRLGIPSV